MRLRAHVTSLSYTFYQRHTYIYATTVLTIPHQALKDRERRGNGSGTTSPDAQRYSFIFQHRLSAVFLTTAMQFYAPPVLPLRRGLP